MLFAAAHEQLVTMELARRTADELESWFIQGRIAYYLAGIDPARSTSEFGETFEHAPVLDRTSCRIWLANLVDRQSHLLGETSRAVAFFRGFRYYVDGDRKKAVGEFNTVLASNDQDLYRAISLHLRAVSTRNQMTNAVVEMLNESIELSRHLELGANEVMARHSLIWLLIRKGTPVQEVLGLAVLNFEQSRLLADKNLLGWCTRTLAVVRWLDYVGLSRETVTPEARTAAHGLLGDLSEALALAEATDDPETALVTLNDRASILCDLGELDNALIELEAALERAPRLGYAARILSGLGKTSGRAAKLARTADMRFLSVQFWRLSSEFRRISDQFSAVDERSVLLFDALGKPIRCRVTLFLDRAPPAPDARTCPRS